MASLSMRNFLCDYSLSPPEDDSIASTSRTRAKDLPVLHIFGILPSGKKACAHVHGVLPYLLVKVGGGLNERIQYLIRAKMNRILHRELVQVQIPDGSRIPDYVHHIESVESRSMYGYHSNLEIFAKIFLSNPYHVQKLFSALGRECAHNPFLQPFEAHVPFVLQFFMDHSIFGMDHVYFRNVKFRIPPHRPDCEVLVDSLTVGDARDLGQLSNYVPMTTCWVEFDVMSSDILNSEMHSRNLHSSNPGLEYIWKEEANRCILQGRKLEDTFNSYESRPSRIQRSEKESLKKMKLVARHFREQLVERPADITLDLNDTIVGAQGTQHSSVQSLEHVWSQETEICFHNMPGYTYSIDMEHEKDILNLNVVDDEDEEINASEMLSQIVPKPKNDNKDIDQGIEDNRASPRPTSPKPPLSPESCQERVEVIPLAYRNTKWLEPDAPLPLKTRRRAGVQKEDDISIRSANSEVSSRSGSSFPQHDLKLDEGVIMVDSNKMSLNDTTLCKSQIVETVFQDNMAITDGDVDEVAFLCVASLETFAHTNDSMPNPLVDPIIAVSICITEDTCRTVKPALHRVITTLPRIHAASKCLYAACEHDLIDLLLCFLNQYDPDILIGYDVDRRSWGYLSKRAETIGYGSLHPKISRFVKERQQVDDDPLIMRTPAGRLLVSVWRAVRKDLQLRSYDRGTASQAVLHEKLPMLDDKAFTEMLARAGPDTGRSLVFNWLRLSSFNIQLLSEMDWFLKNAEMARVYGIQFHEVWTRGSQLRVESMLLRLAHKMKFIAPSMTVDQRNEMCAPEQLQLILEPNSKVYHDPVIVLDFQSLYPSMVIAYNYCFSTLFGKTAHLQSACELDSNQIEMGGISYDIDKQAIVESVAKRQVHVSPLGAAFVHKATRDGIMPILLREVLGARIMVKTAIKFAKSKRLKRILDARQLALKLVANVTYGYTAANWSGRMPCVEIADAILGKGRETLERAIELVTNGNYNGAKVIYGDTDSMFVLVPGVSLAQAFDIGKRIANDVTNDNPTPVVLKLEKVYTGCVLETKKRYAGWMFESLQDQGKLDSKGIETVRRDTCPIVAKIMEKSLELILQRDYQGLNVYLNRKISTLDSLPYTDFVFCKEYRSDYKENASVPQKEIAEYMLKNAPAHHVLRGERLPYIVISGHPTATVLSCVRPLSVFVSDPDLTIHYEYYIRAHIMAALRRVTDLIPIKIDWRAPPAKHCFNPRCSTLGLRPWCSPCSTLSETYIFANLVTNREERILTSLRDICRSCIRTRYLRLDLCQNHACVVKQVLVSTDRSYAPIAVEEHDAAADSQIGTCSDVIIL